MRLFYNKNTITANHLRKKAKKEEPLAKFFPYLMLLSSLEEHNLIMKS